jgi:tetratricopeptide (TPR) repeat protein
MEAAPFPSDASADLVAVLDPCALPRLERLFLRGALDARSDSVWRAVWRDRRVLLVRLDPAERAAVESDPILRRAVFARVRGREDSAAGTKLALDSAGGGWPGPAEVEAISTMEPEPALRPQSIALLPRPGPPAVLRWRPRRERPRGWTDGLWAPAARVSALFWSLERERAALWESMSVLECADGIVLAGSLPAGLRPALTVPLRRCELGNGAFLFVEDGLELPPLVPALLAEDGEAAHGGRAFLARVEDGQVRIESLSAPGREAWTLIAPAARGFDVGSFDVGAQPATEEPPSGAEETGQPTGSSAEGVVAWLRGAATAAGAVPEAPSAPSRRAPSPPEGPSQRPRWGWLRRFAPKRLRDGVRRRLDRSSSMRLANPRERQRILRSGRRALLELVRGLSGPRWRDAIGRAFPLHEPIPSDPGPWIAVDLDLAPREPEFSLESLAEKPRLGAISVDRTTYKEFVRLYTRAGERLAAEAEYRKAAYVFSYLLGDHGRAGRLLEQGGHAREAATLFYHFAREPRRAAVALERGGLHAEAARLWMDLGAWRRAAQAWSQVDDEAQSEAAWRRLASGLEQRQRLLEAAEVLETELRAPERALDVLVRCVRTGGEQSLDALERALLLLQETSQLERARRLVRDEVDAAVAAARSSARRPQQHRLIALAARLAAWSGSPRFRGTLSSETARAVWLLACEHWTALREEASASLRAELDPLLVVATQALGDASGDPWLCPNLVRFLETAPPAAAALAAPSAIAGANEPFAAVLPGPCTALHVDRERLVAACEDGSVLVRSHDGCVEARLETGSGRPVRHVCAVHGDLYASTDDEVHHFVLSALDAAACRRSEHRPVQIQRSLAGGVHALLAFEDATGVLRLGLRGLHVLHPAHLGVMGTLLSSRRRSLAALAVHRRAAAVLINHGRSHPADDDARFEVVVLERRGPGARSELRQVESFPVACPSPQRLAFLGGQGDELLVGGDETLHFFPSQRQKVTVFHLELTSSRGRLQPARLAGLPGQAAVAIAYGDGSVEVVELTGGRRRWAAGAPRGDFDAVADFQLDPAAPNTAWVLHRSGRLRCVRLDAPGGR